MPATLTIRDETTAGQVEGEWTLDFLTEHITVRELIRSRVYQEVQDYNLRQPPDSSPQLGGRRRTSVPLVSVPAESPSQTLAAEICGKQAERLFYVFGRPKCGERSASSRPT